jgi:hypothetical protein
MVFFKFLDTRKGKSEYSKRFIKPDSIDLENAKYVHSVSKDHLKMHNLRNKKYQDPDKYLKITGTTENRFRYTNTDSSLYKKPDKIYMKSELSVKEGIFVAGSTEYNDKYNQIEKFRNAQHANNPPFVINPTADIPYEFSGHSDNNAGNQPNKNTQYKVTYQWPDQQQIDRLPWSK